MNDSLKTCNLYHLTGQVCTQRGVPLMSARRQRHITLYKQLNYNKRGGVKQAACPNADRLDLISIRSDTCIYLMKRRIMLHAVDPAIIIFSR